MSVPLQRQGTNSKNRRSQYTYTADGRKLRVVQKWNPNYNTTPVIGSAVNTASLTHTRTTDHIGNKIYEDGTLKKILIEGGYYDNTDKQYYFFMSDHLGNNRVVTDQRAGVIQKNHYYPFGLTYADNTLQEQSKQPYKYNGKELDQMHGLNQYDYSARYYEPAISRFTTVDPLAEKYYSISPYVYVANNPIKFIDPDGKQIGEPFGSPKDLRNHAINTNISKLQIHAVKPAAIGKSISGSLPFNLVNTITPGIEAVLITKGPKEGSLAIYGTFSRTEGLPDIGVSESLTIYHLEGDERRIDEKSFVGKSTGKTGSVGLMGNTSIGINKSESETSDGDKIKGQGINIGYGKSLHITGKKEYKSSILIKTFQIYGNKNEKYNPNEKTNDYYIRKYTDLKEYEKSAK